VDISRLQVRSLKLHEIALLLCGTPEQAAERTEEMGLLYGELVKQNISLFTCLLTTHRRVLRALLWRGPEQTIAVQQSISLADRGMDTLRRTINDVIGIQMFSGKNAVAKTSKKLLYYVTRSHFEVSMMLLYRTVGSTAPTLRAAIRVRNLVTFLGLMVTRLLDEQQGANTRNLRHRLYRDALMLIIEADKGGLIMKYAWRLGPNRLVPIGAFEAADTHPNMMVYTEPWYVQLEDIMLNGITVRRPAGDIREIETVVEQQQEEEQELEDLRRWLVPVGEVDTGLVSSATDQLEAESGQERAGEADESQESEGDVMEQREVEEDEPMEVEAAEFIDRHFKVKVFYAGDMAKSYAEKGLSGASGSFPSPTTLVTRLHLKGHAASSKPHNWEQKRCVFPNRLPDGLDENWMRCSQDTRNGGDPAKNAKHHGGQKAPRMNPYRAGIQDLTEAEPPQLLHYDLGIIGVATINHMVVVQQIRDGTATEADLLKVTDLLAEERVAEGEDGEETEGPELMLHSQELRVKAAELNLAEAELQAEVELCVAELERQARVQAVARGDEEELHKIAKKAGQKYLSRRFRAGTANFSCSSYCLLTGIPCDP
jgi:hypothetical protein